MDCRSRICEILTEIKAARVEYLEETLCWHGLNRDEIKDSIRLLVERGVIYKKRGGVVEMADEYGST
jgi:hypothetical protein